MAKKTKNDSNNGRGSGSGNPSFRGRGRGQVVRGGGPSGGQPTGRGYLHGSKEPKIPGSSFMQEEVDFTIRMSADAAKPPQDPVRGKWNGYSTPRGFQRGGRGSGRGRDRGRGEFNTPANGNTGRGGYNSPRGTDTPSRRGRGRGRGLSGSRHDFQDFSPRHGRGLGASANSILVKNLGPNSTLSDILSASRPLLRPIKFVRSEYAPFLFQIDQEEIFKPVVEEIRQDDASHVPTADRVERIFHRNVHLDGSSSSSSSNSDEGEEEIEEIDFNSLDQLLASPKRDNGTTRTKKKVKVNNVLQMVEDQVTTGFYHQPKGQGSAPYPEVVHTVMEAEETTTISQQLDDQLFFIDTNPAGLPAYHKTSKPPTPPEDDEIIVYVAPHPKVRSHSSSRNQPNEGASIIELTHQTSVYQPYNPPPTLPLASMSINDFQLTAEEQQVDKVPISPGPTTIASDQVLADSASEVHSTTLPIPTISSLKFDFSSAFDKAPNSLSISGRRLTEIIPSRIAKKQKMLERKKRKRERKTENKGRRGSLAAYGALLNDARLYDGEDVLVHGVGKDPRWEERRRGDSDVDWGTEESDDEQNEGEHVFAGGVSEKAKGKQKARDEAGDVEADHGMDVDLEMDVGAMKQFVSGLMGENADRFTSMDDIEDEKKIRAEDEEGLGGAKGSSDEDDDDENIEAILDLEEKLLIGEGADDEHMDIDGEDSDDDEFDLSPRSGFQARLEKMRARARSKRLIDVVPDEDDNDEEMLERNLTWAEEEGDDCELIDHIQEILDQNAHIIQGQDRKARNKLFRAVQNGDFADMQPARKRKDKYKDLPAVLLHQWELDRQRKAERKRERELLKLLTAADPYAEKKGGKKGRKAMLRAARTDPDTINLGPNRIIDMTTLVQQIRRFIEDLNSPQSMSLPPTNKETRKNVHELAIAFGLKSISKGTGDARYTTLTKTSNTGLGVDERKVNKIIRRAADREARGDTFGEIEGREDKRRKRMKQREAGEDKGRKRSSVPKQREGDEVGASAPKISAGNVGFKMLAAMGWSEGGKIGLSGGLETPLVAIIKHSKLGLGAMK